ncbi:MAG: adenylate/guanylate cyclase domain-containing protein [Spirochaetales bacterium]|nr:adenylate/guanylate cyclase domain-containing protein [Spirochaetales bacterium]
MASANDSQIEKYKNLAAWQEKKILESKREIEDLKILYENVVEHSTLNEDELEKANLETKELLNSMKKYLSSQLFNSIVRAPSKDLDLSYKRKKFTIFFSDIVGFTQITDMIEPEALSSLLNEYLNEMSEIAVKYGGTIDKFIGDAIMIFFGDTDFSDEDEPGKQCIRMALEMKKKTEALSEGWIAKGSPSHLKIRMGINTGFCTVGNFGSSNRMDYTIIGGQVNLASRLEKISDENSVTISNSTYKLVKDIVVVEPPVSKSIKGISHPIEVYKVIRLKDEEEQSKSEYCITIDNGFVLKPISFDKNYTSESEKGIIVSSLELALDCIRKK